MAQDPAEIIRQHYMAMAAKRMVHDRTCAACGAEMKGVMARRQYCSVRCKSKGRRAYLKAYVQGLEARAGVTSPKAEARPTESPQS